VTFFRQSGQIYSWLVSCFLRGPYTKSYCYQFIFDQVIPKTKRVTFLGHCVGLSFCESQTAELWRNIFA